ncbi:MAG: methyltransferase, TIGR04325 family [Candidatus Riflebacteria bacterium]|nr:methyltransferase, TIGR04325 family [Candidatus Riflebacteria bacterium]
MLTRLKSFLRVKASSCFPQLLKNFRKFFHLENLKTEVITIEGPFKTWIEAEKQATGYQEPEILRKVLTASLIVKTGLAVFERDSILFNRILYSWPVLSALMWSALQNKGELRVLDFGGSLGSSYFQNREFYKGLSKISWGIVEQAHFVETGKQKIQNEQLRFFHSIDECAREINPNIFLLSGVLQYLPHFSQILNQIFVLKPLTIVIDRTFFWAKQVDEIFLQKISPAIYEASYPFYALSESKLIKSFLEQEYELLAEFRCIEFPALERIEVKPKGLIFRKKGI